MNTYLDFINYNLSMLTDRQRVEAYRRAVHRTVKPGDVVLDLGSGSGLLAFFACQARAKRVYAIEAEDVIELAKQVCEKNGFQDRVVFLNDWSFKLELPERADVLVTETMGTFGLDEGMVGAVMDARERMLKPGAVIVPRTLTLYLVPVETPGFYEHMVSFWGRHCQGLDLSPIQRFAVNSFHPVKVHEEGFLSNPVQLGQIALGSVKSSEIAGQITFYAKRRGVCHGLAGWFVAELTDGVVVSNSPTNAASHWGAAFFPLDRPVPVHSGARIAVEMESMSNGTLWRWQVAAGGEKLSQETPSGFKDTTSERAGRTRE